MRNISFRLTQAQVLNRSKTVTRRIGWRSLAPGTILQPVVKSQGLRKGEHVETIGGPIRVVSVRQERLDKLLYMPARYGRDEVRKEGFGRMATIDFVTFFARSHGLLPAGAELGENPKTDEALRTLVTRIEFEYVEVSEIVRKKWHPSTVRRHAVISVLVHADGRLELVTIPENLHVHSVAKIPPMSATFRHDPQPVSFERIDYWRRGKMFDGRPVFCADGLEVKEVRCEAIAAEHDIRVNEKHLFGWLQRQVDGFIERQHAVVIVLDSWRGRVPPNPAEAEEFKAKFLARVAARRLLAVRT